LKDRLSINYRKGASKADPETASEDGSIIKRAIPSKHKLLHNHRSSDSPLDYLYNLEEQ